MVAHNDVTAISQTCMGFYEEKRREEHGPCWAVHDMVGPQGKGQGRKEGCLLWPGKREHCTVRTRYSAAHSPSLGSDGPGGERGREGRFERPREVPSIGRKRRVDHPFLGKKSRTGTGTQRVD